MSKFTSITTTNFEFGPHHSLQLAYLDTALNNVYFEPFETNTIASLFTDVNCPAFTTNAIDLLHSTILDIVVNNSQAHQPTIEPLLNNMPLLIRAGSLKA